MNSLLKDDILLLLDCYSNNLTTLQKKVSDKDDRKVYENVIIKIKNTVAAINEDSDYHE